MENHRDVPAGSGVDPEVPVAGPGRWSGRGHPRQRKPSEAALLTAADASRDEAVTIADGPGLLYAGPDPSSSEG